MIKLFLIISALFLTGCLSNGGESAYTVKPIELTNGKMFCCDVDVSNTKNYDRLEMRMIIKTNGDIEFELIEDGVNASDPAAVAAENNTRLLETVSKLIPFATGN